MSGLAKGLIITAVVLVIAGVILIGGAVYFISTHGGEYLEKGKQSIEDGKRFGETTDNHGCVAETLTRYKQSPGMTGGISVQLFLTGCLQSSAATPGFCDDVPAPSEFMKSASWRVHQCSLEGMANDSYCQQIFGQVQNFCESKRRRSN